MDPKIRHPDPNRIRYPLSSETPNWPPSVRSPSFGPRAGLPRAGSGSRGVPEAEIFLRVLPLRA